MSVYLDGHGFGTAWHDLVTDHYRGYLPRMTDYHLHVYFEISLILSGNVRVLLPGLAESGTDCRLVLMRPRTPHFIVCEPNLLYERRNVLFSGDFIVNYVPEWQRLSSVFGKDGMVHSITAEECREYNDLIIRLEQESDPFRRRLHLLMLLSLIADRMEATGEMKEPPAHITEALAYITEHSNERIVASELAWRLGVGRTTLMTSFKKYTGTTVNEYVLQCRLKNAIRYLRQGLTEQQTAELCGFSDACNLIRSFKRYFKITPKQYLLKQG